MLANNSESRAEIFIYEEIGEGWFGGLTDSAFKDVLQPLRGQDIDVRIDSPGGDVFQGISIANMLERHDGQVRVFIDGLAASIASVIAMAGDEIIAPSNTMMMIHDPWTITIGNSAEHAKQIEILDKVKGQIVETYMHKATVDADRIRELMASETWLTAQEAAAIGLVDTVTEFGKSQARASLARFEGLYSRIPENLLAASREARNALPKDQQKATWRQMIAQFKQEATLRAIRRDRKQFRPRLDAVNGKTEPVTYENSCWRRINHLKTKN